ncbi:MAG TPA: hypothetical protein VF746_13245 [Longimicrobium sp.]|jgi:hypothetical protein
MSGPKRIKPAGLLTMRAHTPHPLASPEPAPRHPSQDPQARPGRPYADPHWLAVRWTERRRLVHLARRLQVRPGVLYVLLHL